MPEDFAPSSEKILGRGLPTDDAEFQIFLLQEPRSGVSAWHALVLRLSEKPDLPAFRSCPGQTERAWDSGHRQPPGGPLGRPGPRGRSDRSQGSGFLPDRSAGGSAPVLAKGNTHDPRPEAC